MCWLLLFNYSFLHFRKCIHSFSFPTKVSVSASIFHINPTRSYFSLCAPVGLRYIKIWSAKPKTMLKPTQMHLHRKLSATAWVCDLNCWVFISSEYHSCSAEQDNCSLLVAQQAFQYALISWIKWVKMHWCNSMHDEWADRALWCLAL